MASDAKRTRFRRILYVSFNKCSWDIILAAIIRVPKNVISTYKYHSGWAKIDHFVANGTFKASRGVPGQVAENVNSTYKYDGGWAQIDHFVAKGTLFVYMNTFDIGHYGLRRKTHAA